MDETKPLAGIRVLEVAAYISGPYAGSILAALGAEVVKVEPTGGEPFRRGEGTKSKYFSQYNAGKRSIALNLKSPGGIDLVKQLLPKFDVLIENSRPGKTEALGLGPEVCKAINPRLVYASVSGFGGGGPWRDRAAYDSIGQSMGGLYSIMNDEGSPRLTGTPVGDLTTAIIACMGVLAGLVGRTQDPEGRGIVAETSLLEAMSTITVDAMSQFIDTGVSPTRQSRHPQAQNFCLMTASGEAVTVHLSSSQKFWENFTRTLDRPDLAEDPRFKRFADRECNYFELRPIVEAEFLKRTAEEWQARLVEFDVPFAPVLTMETLANHPQYEFLGMHRKDDEGRVFVQPPWRFDGTRPERAKHVPEIGEHSTEIASEVLAPDAIKALIASGDLVQHKVGATD